MRVAALLAVVASGGLAACTSTKDLPAAPQFPAPTIANYTQQYPLQVGDVLDIRLLLNPELNEEVTIRPDGHISTIVMPDAIAAGRSVPELEKVLVRGYTKDIQNPRISVEVKSVSATHVYVGGEVPAPGEFVTSPGTQITLSQAMTRAGGLKPSGDSGAVFIIRRPEPLNSQPLFMSVRYADVIHARDANADVVLAPWDVVYVPKTGIAEVYAFYQAYLGQFANPNFNFSYLLNPTPNTNVIPTH